MSATINISRGQIVIIDEEDHHWLSEFKWSAAVCPHTIYAYRTVRNSMGKRTTLLMHRFIWERHYGPIPGKLFIDHIDRNGTNNTKSNLRLCNNSQNMSNGNKHRDAATSIYKGIVMRRNGLWRACIRVMGVLIYLGTFNNEIDAAIAYDVAAIKYFGEFAKTNFVNMQH